MNKYIPGNVCSKEWTDKTRYHSIDCIKFILAIGIICHHYQQVTGVSFDGINFYGGKFYFGYFVEAFFILSGFLVAAAGLDRITADGFWPYLKRKAIRLYPMAILSVLFIWVAEALYYLHFDVFRGDTVSIGAWTLICSLALIFSGGAVKLPNLALNNPLWYLSVLLICYVTVYIVCWVAGRSHIEPIKIIFFAEFLFLGIYGYELDLPFLIQGSSRGLTAFFWGILLYHMISRFSEVRYTILSIFLLVLFALLTLRFGDLWIDNQWGVWTFIVFPLILHICIFFEKIFIGKFW